MRYLADVAHHFLVLALFAALAGVGFSVALELSRLRAPPTADAAQTVDTVERELAARRLLVPVQGIERRALRDSFAERRGLRRHEAIDIPAAKGTPVVAVADGFAGRLSRNVAGGITLHLVDGGGRFVYYYAHLDRYAEGLAPGASVRRGEIVGYVGATGNARESAPHLHFAIFRIAPGESRWKGEPVNPYPYLRGPPI